ALPRRRRHRAARAARRWRRRRLRGRGRAGGAGRSAGARGERRRAEGRQVMRAIVLAKRPADVALVSAAAALGETTAIAVGSEADVLAVLAGARAAGATRLVRLWDPGLETTDYLDVAYTLAAAIRAIGDPALSPTAILAGDRGRGVVGPAVAERLGIPLLGQVLSLSLADDKLVAKRR